MKSTFFYGLTFLVRIARLARRIEFKSFNHRLNPYTAGRQRFLSYQSLIVVYNFLRREFVCRVFFSFVAEIKNILFMYIDSFLFFLCVLAVTCICGFKCSRYISCPHVPFCEIYSFLASRGLVTLFLGDIVAQVFFLPFL